MNSDLISSNTHFNKIRRTSTANIPFKDSKCATLFQKNLYRYSLASLKRKPPISVPKKNRVWKPPRKNLIFLLTFTNKLTSWWRSFQIIRDPVKNTTYTSPKKQHIYTYERTVLSLGFWIGENNEIPDLGDSFKHLRSSQYLIFQWQILNNLILRKCKLSHRN